MLTEVCIVFILESLEDAENRREWNCYATSAASDAEDVPCPACGDRSIHFQRSGAGNYGAIKRISGRLVQSRAECVEFPRNAQYCFYCFHFSLPALQLSNTFLYTTPIVNIRPIPEGTPKFVKLDSGIRYQELTEGSGTAATSKSLVLIDYVLRRSNGYFIYSTVEGVSFQPKDLPIGPIVVKLDDPRVVAGLREALVGMKPGARRRILVPPSLGYEADTSLQPQPPGYAAQRQVIVHSKEPLLFEVQVLRVDGGRT